MASCPERWERNRPCPKSKKLGDLELLSFHSLHTELSGANIFDSTAGEGSFALYAFLIGGHDPENTMSRHPLFYTALPASFSPSLEPPLTLARNSQTFFDASPA